MSFKFTFSLTVLKELEELHDVVKTMGPGILPNPSEMNSSDDLHQILNIPESTGTQYPLFQNIQVHAQHFEKLLSICSEYAMIDTLPLLAFVRKIEGHLNKQHGN